MLLISYELTKIILFLLHKSTSDASVISPKVGFSVIPAKAGVRAPGLLDPRFRRGDGSFQALDASYPIAEEFWPDWLKKKVERFRNYRK